MTIAELSQFYHITREIADLRRRIRELELKAQPNAARMSGMPGGGGVADPTGDLAAELEMLGRVVYCEAGSSWISDRHQQLVACVVLNRCADSRFPATITDNVYKRGQYACAGRLYSVSREKIPARCFDNAKMAAYDCVECPAAVVWQAQFKQGRGIYEKIGNTYFCY